MASFTRIAFAAALLGSFGSMAHAQSQARAPQTSPDRYEALAEGRSVNVDSTLGTSGTVPPTESRTVMGLRVPR